MMASGAYTHVKGSAELEKALREVPEKMAKGVMRSALRAGAKAYEDAARQLVPVGQPSAEGVRMYGHYRGALRDSLRLSTKVSSGLLVSAKVVAGGKLKNGADVFYAHFVEFGTAAHVISASPGRTLSVGGGHYQHVQHPGAKPQPFMRPAYDSRTSEAIRAIGDKVTTAFAKNGIYEPSPLMEGDE